VVKTVDCHLANSSLIISGSHWWHRDEQAAKIALVLAPEKSNLHLYTLEQQSQHKPPRTPRPGREGHGGKRAPLVMKGLKCWCKGAHGDEVVELRWLKMHELG